MDVTEINQVEFPQVIVVGSRRFASVRETSDGRVYEKLHQLLKWNKTIINYHPLNTNADTRPLIRELGFKYGFSEAVLVEPENPEQTLDIVDRFSDRIFMQGMG